MIETKNLTKIYKMGKETLTALNNVNIKINDGEYVAITGPSGSGKSTLMHMLGGLDSPTSGKILINGKNIAKFKDKDASKYRNTEIGFIFQTFNLENTQTALENVMMPLIFSNYSGKEMRKKALKALELVDLTSHKNHKPMEMSGGQRQRVAIARALVNNPKIIFGDEPTGNLDSKNGTQVMELLKDLNNKGFTIILVTHNEKEALRAKRIISIYDGEIKGDVLNEIR